MLYLLRERGIGLSAIVSLQHGALVGHFADHEAPGQFTAFVQVSMRPVLSHA